MGKKKSGKKEEKKNLNDVRTDARFEAVIQSEHTTGNSYYDKHIATVDSPRETKEQQTKRVCVCGYTCMWVHEGDSATQVFERYMNMHTAGCTQL